MWNLMKAELLKLRRCQIFLVGFTALALCPFVQYGSQLIISAKYRDPNFDFTALFENVVWGNTQIFLPVSLVMIGGWFIDRESAHDTLKNIMTIPVSMPKLLGVKLLLIGIMTVLLGIYSTGVTLITGGGCWFAWVDCAGAFLLWHTDCDGSFDNLSGLYAPYFDFWADSGSVSGWFDSDIFPWVQHDVFQRRCSVQHIPVFSCTDSGGL